MTGTGKGDALIVLLWALVGVALLVTGIVRERLPVFLLGLAMVVVSVLGGLYLTHIDFGYYFPRTHF